jgi:hypothetical protein
MIHGRVQQSIHKLLCRMHQRRIQSLTDAKSVIRRLITDTGVSRCDLLRYTLLDTMLTR